MSNTDYTIELNGFDNITPWESLSEDVRFRINLDMRAGGDTYCPEWEDILFSDDPPTKMVLRYESLVAKQTGRKPHDNFRQAIQANEEFARIARLEYHAPDRAEATLSRAGNVALFWETAPFARDWLIPNVIPAQRLGRLIAPGGTGKSMLALQLLVSAATGTSWLGFEPAYGGPIPVALMTMEDEMDEIHRRVYSIAQGMKEDGIEFDRRLLNNLKLMAPEGEDWRLLSTAGRSVERNNDNIKALHQIIGRSGASLLALDPQASFFGADENSNSDAQMFIDMLRGAVKLSGCGIMLIHHTNKASMNGGNNGVSSARGASAFRDGCRYEIALEGMDPKTAKDHRLDQSECRRYVKLSFPKANYALAESDLWLERGYGGYLRKTELQAPEPKRKSDDVMVHDAVVSIIENAKLEGNFYTKTNFVRLFRNEESVYGLGRDSLFDVLAKLIEGNRLREIPVPEHLKAKSSFNSASRVLDIFNPLP